MKANIMKSLCVLSWILLFCSFTIEAALKTSYVEDLCLYKTEETIDLRRESSIILISKQSLYGKRYLECNIKFLTKYGTVLSIYRHNLSPEHQLIIEDSDNHKISLLGRAEFRNEKKSMSFDGNIIIRYKVNNTGYPLSTNGFQFTITQVHDKPCYSSEFACKNGKCIAANLLCNGHNHCGDNSNNEKCVPVPVTKNEVTYYRSPTITIWIIIVIVVSVILLIVIIVFSIALVKLKRKRATVAKGTNSPNNANGNVNLQSVSAGVPTNAAAMMNAQNVRLNANVNGQRPGPPMTVFTQIRRSLRGLRSAKKEDVPLEQTRPEAYQVPSMYPNLEQLPSAPAIEGVDNPEFKIED